MGLWRRELMRAADSKKKIGLWIILKRRSVRIWLVAAGSLVLVLFVIWQRCGLKGCLEVERLRTQQPNQASVLLTAQGQELAKLFVERRMIVELNSLPPHVSNAFVAMEDQRFWQHEGVDWIRVFGAAWQNIKELGIEEGASTITMQLARNVFPEALPSNQQTIARKLLEARVAIDIEDRFTKREILELYLNQIYFGNGAYGIETAAQEYFGKPAASLSLAEAATLAAIPRSPARFNPRNNRERSTSARKVVLGRMAAQRMITLEQAAQAVADSIHLGPGHLKSLERASYFVEAVRRILEAEVGEAIYRNGLTIHTTLDLATQTVVEEELHQQIQAIESGTYGQYRHITYAGAKRDTADPENAPYLQAAAVFMDPRTGDVRALVGGRDYEDSQYNRATQAMRQPGSAFKPFVYAAALAAGYPPSHRLIDRPFRLMLDDRRAWEPQNYDGSFAGVVSLREALTYSKNVPTIRLGMEIGIDRVLAMARQLGLEGQFPSVPAVLLGAAEVTPLALTSAFSTFATLGNHVKPRLVTRVVDRHGVVVWSQEAISTRALNPAAAYLVTSILKDVVDRGTGTAARAAGFRGVAAGKTGTTNDAADVWFVGYTPRVIGTIWIGFDRPQPILPGATGGELAAPFWGRVMRRAAEPTGDWAMPAGIQMRLVDAQGNVVPENCPRTTGMHHEYFLRGRAPFASCFVGPLDEHAEKTRAGRRF